MKVGQVAILGRPNTGKSTLINAILQQKVSITSPLPQTTRKVVEGVYQDERGQIIFWDTPGLTTKVADVILCVFDISRPKSDEDNKIIGISRKLKAKKILVYNKTDRAVGSKDHLAEYNFLEDEFDKTVAVSALKEKGVKQLVNEIFELLGEGEARDERGEMVIRTSSDEFIGEIIREKAYLYLRREVPYSVKVAVDEIRDKGKIMVVKARILTDRERLKKMIIGKKGRKIKQIGSHARKELELMSGKGVFLDLMVGVDKHWKEGY